MVQLRIDILVDPTMQNIVLYGIFSQMRLLLQLVFDIIVILLTFTLITILLFCIFQPQIGLDLVFFYLSVCVVCSYIVSIVIVSHRIDRYFGDHSIVLTHIDLVHTLVDYFWRKSA
jgi:hypothetical protein